MLNQILEKLDKIETMLKAQSVKLMTLDEVSEYLKVSRSHMYKLTSMNQIPFYKPNGKIVYFKKSEIDDWVLKNRRKTKEEIDEIADEYIREHPRKY